LSQLAKAEDYEQVRNIAENYAVSIFILFWMKSEFKYKN
jgi:hypothetical protein